MPRLEYIDNAGGKSVVNLSDGASISIGRNPGSSIHTTNPSVSRNHGRVYQKSGRWLVKDLGSSNGTYLNDEPIQQSRLDNGDLIRCGDFVLHFHEDGRAVADTPRDGNGDRKKKKKKDARTRKPGQGTADPFSFTDDELDSRMEEPPARRTLKPKNLAPTAAKLPIQKKLRRGEGSGPVVLEEPAKRRESTSARRARDDERAEKRRKPKSKRKEAPPEEEPKGPSENEERLVAQIKEQAEEIDQLGHDLKESRGFVSDLEAKLEEFEGRATRYEVELDSITEKYVQLKDQLTLSKERLDETREELADKEDKLFQLEARISELDSELESARDRATDSAEVTANFKIKITQRDRQVEELQRQYDLQEFEFRAVREELVALQEGYNADAGDTAKLERRINQLREIIADKENVISEARLELENKDIEIRQVRMGMGMTDLEDEKRKLLEDYYEKNREADQLRDEKKAMEVEFKGLEEKIAEIEAELEQKSDAMNDITGHPDYKAKVREAHRHEERIAELEGELGSAEEKLGEFTAEDKKRLQGEVAFFKRKSTTIEDKLNRAQERATELEGELETARAAAKAAPAAPTEPVTVHVSDEAIQEKAAELKAALGEDLESIYEMFVQWRSNFSLFENYLEEVGAVIDGLEGDAKASGTEAMESVNDLLRVVESDAKALKRGLNKFKKKVIK